MPNITVLLEPWFTTSLSKIMYIWLDENLYPKGQKYTHHSAQVWLLPCNDINIAQGFHTAYSIFRFHIIETKCHAMSKLRFFCVRAIPEAVWASFLAQDCTHLFACALISFQLFRPAEGRIWAMAAKQESHSWPQWRKLRWPAWLRLLAHIHTHTHTHPNPLTHL